MVSLKATTAPSFTATTAASEANHCVRKVEHDADIAGRAASSHEHLIEGVTGLEEYVRDLAGQQFDDSESVAWSYVDSGTARATADVRLKDDGGLDVDAGGVHVLIGSGSTEAAAGNHTHENDHLPATVQDSTSVHLTLTEQDLQAEVIADAAGGLVLGDSGIAADFGSGTNQIPRGDHVHANDHAILTTANSNTATLTLADQQLTVAVKLKVNPGYGNAGLASDSEGIYLPLGESGTQAARGNHEHDLATQFAHGFLSATDKAKLDRYQELLQADYPVLFHRPDAIAQDEYVGGQYKWDQDMEVVQVNATAEAGTEGITLSLTVSGEAAFCELSIPAGTPNNEVAAGVTPTDVFIPAGTWSRWKCTVGASTIIAAPTRIDLAMNVRPALDSIPEIKLNCGGGVESPFGTDQYYVGGSGLSLPDSVVDLSGVTSPAPLAAYTTARIRYHDQEPFYYELTGLAKAIPYKVRLHFADILYAIAGDQVFDIIVTGRTTSTVESYDIIAAAGGPLKATVREFTINPDCDGKITVMLQPISGNGGKFNAMLNALEAIRA